MAVEQQERAPPEVERLLLDLARICHWTGLYRPDHPFLSVRGKSVHAALVAQAGREPGNRLLLGIARDRVMYRDTFFGQGHPLVTHFTETFYLHQVATIGFGTDCTPEGLLGFFRCLHDSKAGTPDLSPEAFLRQGKVPGISVYPYNYKEVLSRRTSSAEEGGDLSGRGDALWRMLLTANIADDGGENKVVQELADAPELLPAILKRARADAEKGEDPSASPFLPDGGAVPPEVMCRMFRRLGEKLRTLPMDRKEAVLLSLDQGLEAGDGPSAASIADGYTDDEFLDLLATVLYVEGKGGKRLRKIFETIADQRDVGGSLLPRLNDRARESLRTKEYFSKKTWEAVETLLLSRSEDAYLEEEHSRFMEALSGDAGRMAARAASLPPDHVLLAAFGEEAQHRQAMAVLLELLAMEKNDAEFLDLLEEIRKHLPNMISRKEFPLLEKVLGVLSAVQKTAPGSGPVAVKQVTEELDFGHIVDLYLSRELPAEDALRIPSLLAAFGREASVPVLERLLMEPEANRRKILVSLAVRIGVEAVPAIQERLSHPRWYFVRNLCHILGEIGFRGAVYGLARVLDHDDPRVRKEAIQALGKLKAPQAVPFLGKILVAETLFSSQKEESLRLEAATALFRIGGTDAVGYLHQGKSSRKAAVREHCSTLLRSRGEP
jgi:hypothetical protein